MNRKLNREFLTVLIVATLTLVLSAAVYGRSPTGAPDPVDEFSAEAAIAGMAQPDNDPWYDIEPETPHFGAGFTWCIDDPLYNLDYYVNDHTYAGINLLFPPPNQGYDMISEIYGSYLFKFGVFIGADYYKWGDNYNWTLSPGYRFDLNNQGYVAVSVDYLGSNYSDSEVAGYKLDGEYYNDSMLIDGNVYVPKEGTSTFALETNFKATEELVWGIHCNGGDRFDYTAGLTWSRGPWAFDAEAGSQSNAFHYGLNGQYNLTEHFAGGIEYSKTGNDAALTTLKLKYTTKIVTLNVMYQLDPKMFYITYRLGM